MPTVNLQSYKVLAQELSSSTKFNNLVQAVEDALNGIDGDNFGIKSTAATDIVKGLVTGDTVPRIRVQADGKIEWGAGGAAAVDTNLYRPSANRLGTDDDWAIGTLMLASAGQGWQQYTETTDPTAPATNNVRFYARDNGAGKTQLVARFPTGAIQVVATEP